MSRLDRIEASYERLGKGGIEWKFTDDVREVNPQADLFEPLRLFAATPGLIAIARAAEAYRKVMAERARKRGYQLSVEAYEDVARRHSIAEVALDKALDDFEAGQ